MSIKIRKGMFETNSSSAHVLVISKSKLLDKYCAEDEIRKHMNSHYEYIVAKHKKELIFERYPFMFLNSINDKIRFLSAYTCGENKDKILKILQKVCPECRRLIYPTETDTKIFNRTSGEEIDRDILSYSTASYGNDNIIETDNRLIDDIEFKNTEIPYYGYVDHQSSNLLCNLGKNNNLTLQNIILNNTIFIIIDGDEYDSWRKLKECGLVNADEIKKEYYNEKIVSAIEEEEDEDAKDKKGDV